MASRFNHLCRSVKVALFLLSICSVGLAAARSQSTIPAAGEFWPTKGWRASRPEAQGLDSDVLADAFDFLREKHVPIHSLLIERNGWIILDAYFSPFSDNQLHDLASVTKSVTSTLVGIAIGQGKLAGVDERVSSIFPEEPSFSGDPRKASIKIRDFLSMTSGLYCEFDHGEPTLAEMWQSPHWAHFILSLPRAAAPGSTFVYNSGGMHVLSTVITKVTGKSALEYARSELFAPLGIGASKWPADPDGISHGWGDLHLQPRDMAKIGYLWLHGGRWDGRQIIPRDYMDAATKVHSRAPWNEQYGFGFWVYPEHTPPLYEGNGRGGQRITVLPSKNMVLVLTGGGFEPGDIGKFILKAIKSDSPLPVNCKGEGRLAVAIAAVAQPPSAHEPLPLPPLARAISGRVYALDRNPLGIKSLAFTFLSPREASVEVVVADGHVEKYAVGLDGIPRAPITVGPPIAIEGAWKADALVLNCDQVADINAFVVTLKVSGSDLAIHAIQRKGTGGLDTTFFGHRSN